MGADLIIATLWAEAGPEHDHTEERSGRPHTFSHRDPVLDWQVGHDYIDSLVWTREDILEADNWSNIVVADVDTLSDGALLTVVRKTLHDKLDEIKVSVEDPGRDTDVRLLDDVLLYLSGGPSWGDSPTETAELWWSFGELGEYLTGLDQILTRVGFFWLGSDDAPFKIVRK